MSSSSTFTSPNPSPPGLIALANKIRTESVGSTVKLDPAVIIRQVATNRMEGNWMVIAFLDGEFVLERHGKIIFLADKDAAVSLNSKTKQSRIQLVDGKQSFIIPDDIDRKWQTVATAYMQDAIQVSQKKIPESASKSVRNRVLRSQQKSSTVDDTGLDENGYKFTQIEGDNMDSDSLLDGDLFRMDDVSQGNENEENDEPEFQGLSEHLEEALKAFHCRFPVSKHASTSCRLYEPNSWVGATKEELTSMMKKQFDSREFRHQGTKLDFFLFNQLVMSCARDATQADKNEAKIFMAIGMITRNQENYMYEGNAGTRIPILKDLRRCSEIISGSTAENEAEAAVAHQAQRAHKEAEEQAVINKAIGGREDFRAGQRTRTKFKKFAATTVADPRYQGYNYIPPIQYPTAKVPASQKAKRAKPVVVAAKQKTAPVSRAPSRVVFSTKSRAGFGHKK